MNIYCQTCRNQHLTLLGLVKMNRIEDVISGYELSDARAAFYYLSRYLKQADYFEEYKKDFFEDGLQSAPSNKAKELTFALISFIENKAEKKASKFSDEEYMEWMKMINNVESKLDPEPSRKVVESAESVIKEMFLPKLGKND